MAAYLLETVPARVVDDNGDPVPGALLHTYAAGTTTPLATYVDSTGTTQLDNPIEADADGLWPQIWVAATSYKLVANQADDATLLWQRDNVTANEVAIILLTNRLADDTDQDNGAGMIGYDQALAYATPSVGYRLRQTFTAKSAGCDDQAGDVSSALAAAISEADLLGASFEFTSGQTYKIGAAQITFKAGRTYRTNGATFEDLNGTTSNSSLIVIEDGAIVDTLNVSIPTSTRRDRAILIGADCAIGSLSLVSVDQQANRLETNDCGIAVTGAGTVFGSVYIENYDNGIRVDAPGLTTFGKLSGTSYVRLLWVHDSSVNVYGGEINTASPNATNTAGNNAILMSCETVGATHDIHIENMLIEDAGEHAIRIGGPEKIKSVWISKSTIKNPGSCGVKILGTDAGSPTEQNEDVFIDSLIIEDCGTEGALTTNMCGVLVMFSINVTVKNVVVKKNLKTYSAFAGVRVASSSDVKIDTVDVADAQFDGIWLDGSEGDLTRANINGGITRSNGRDGFRALTATNTIRRLNVDGLVCDSNGAYGALISGAGGTIVDSEIRIKSYNNMTDSISCDSTAVHIDVTGVTATPPTAADSSVIKDLTDYKIRKAGAWVTL